MSDKIVVKNFLYKVLVDILKIIIPIITIPYIYRIFSPELMGKVEFSLSIINYFFVFVGFGVYRYGLREISKVRENDLEKNIVFSELFFISLFSIIGVFFIYILYINIVFQDNFILKKMLYLGSLQILSYFCFIEWVNEAFENYKFISLKSILVKLINLFSIFIFIKKPEDYNKYLLIIGIFILINNATSFVYIVFIKKYIKFIFRNLNLKKHLFSLTTLICISNLSILYTQLDKIMLGFYGKNIEQVAYYGISQRIMSIIITVIGALMAVSMPRLSYYLGNDKKEKYEELLNNLFPYVFIILFPVVIGIISISDEIVLILGGKSYIPAKLTLIFFSFRLIVITIENIISNQIIFLHKKEKIIIVFFLIFGIINYFIKLLLIKLNIYNSETAIFTTMTVEIFLMITEYYYVKKNLEINIKVFDLSYLKYFICSLFFFCIKIIFKKNDTNTLIYVGSIIMSCIIFYFSILLILKDEQILKVSKELKKLFRFN